MAVPTQAAILHLRLFHFVLCYTNFGGLGAANNTTTKRRATAATWNYQAICFEGKINILACGKCVLRLYLVVHMYIYRLTDAWLITNNAQWFNEFFIINIFVCLCDFTALPTRRPHANRTIPNGSVEESRVLAGRLGRTHKCKCDIQNLFLLLR